MAILSWANAGKPVSVRIAYVTESFPPDVNGVAQTALRVAEHLVNRGHEPLIIAPEPADGQPRPDRMLEYPVVRVPSFAVPVYPGLRVGLPSPRLRDAVAAHRCDLMHLAGPFVLGASGGAAAKRLHLPTVAVYAAISVAYTATVGKCNLLAAAPPLAPSTNGPARCIRSQRCAATASRRRGLGRPTRKPG